MVHLLEGLGGSVKTWDRRVASSRLARGNLLCP